jgi:hypothetical protein
MLLRFDCLGGFCANLLTAIKSRFGHGSACVRIAYPRLRGSSHCREYQVDSLCALVEAVKPHLPPMFLTIHSSFWLSSS